MLKNINKFDKFKTNLILECHDYSYVNMDIETFKKYFKHEYLRYEEIKDETNDYVLSELEYYKTDDSFVILYLEHEKIFSKTLSTLLVFTFNYIDCTIRYEFYHTIDKDEKNSDYLLDDTNINVEYKDSKLINNVNDFNKIIVIFLDVLNVMHEYQVEQTRVIKRIVRHAKFKMNNQLTKYRKHN
jgi:hypothetical protein